MNMVGILNSQIKSLIMDMDGVLWKDDQPLVDFKNIAAVLNERNLKFMFATNNAVRSVAQYQEKFYKLFGVDIEPWQIMTSSLATAAYLGARLPEGGLFYIIGGRGLTEALAEKNIYHPENYQEASGVVAGLDLDLTYLKLRQATYLIRAGKPFVGTNPDINYPSPEGLAPGAGTILAALEIASGVKPVIIGKPNPPMMEVSLQRLGTLPGQTLVIGDRLDTDILGGQNAGCLTALVLSGISTEEELKTTTYKPDFVATSLETLIY
jgi:4-nitrophenyl phosphatase